ncbi:MAG: hypothetical protein V8Q30_01195 [Acutalibacteraceae bacterium]
MNELPLPIWFFAVLDRPVPTLEQPALPGTPSTGTAFPLSCPGVHGCGWGAGLGLPCGRQAVPSSCS